MSPWKCLEKFLQGEWTEYSLWTVTRIWSCVYSFYPGRKVPVTIYPCSVVKGDKNVCSRLYEHEELNNTITLHLLKTYCMWDAFNIQYPLSQKPPKTDIGIFSLQRRTLKWKWSHNLPKVTLLPSHICTHVPISVWACFLFFLAILYLHISVHYRSETQMVGIGIELTFSRTFLLMYFVSFWVS